MIFISELKKKQEAIKFDEQFFVKEKLVERNHEIIDISDVRASGTVSYEEGLFLLNYRLTYTLVMPSSRSMEPVTLKQEDDIQEIFIEEGNSSKKQNTVDDDIALLLTGDVIDIEESVIDNILLALPLQVLTAEEEKSQELPQGDDWTVMTEEQYQRLQAENKKTNNPFTNLNSLFDE